MAAMVDRSRGQTRAFCPPTGPQRKRRQGHPPRSLDPGLEAQGKTPGLTAGSAVGFQENPGKVGEIFSPDFSPDFLKFQNLKIRVEKNGD